MSFTFSDEHIESYHRHGYAIFRQIFPESLLGDLRRVSDRAREIARERSGGQVQRLQPVGKFDIDQQPFIDYAELPPLNDAIHRLLTPRHYHADSDFMGILLEPAELPWCTAWHRDWRDNMAGLPLSMWDELFSDIRYFNQVNCALYDDHSTWVVPGSHLRRDLPREVERFPDRPIQPPNLEGKNAEERKRIFLAYCRSMPGGEQVILNAGDYMLYRNTLWHLGSYVPYLRRATLHDGVLTPEFKKFITDAVEISAERRKAGHAMENPNR
ncbi:MAG: hypothetical protein FJY97_00880 [candidate division Zixibacteria bacterium]|nr:hypothetical protein [candidate division Zixibacteria bacterium]